MVILSSEALYDDTACSLTCGRRPANQAIIEVARVSGSLFLDARRLVRPRILRLR